MNRIRFTAALDSIEVGNVPGGQIVHCIAEATIQKPDGSEVRRLEINAPKAGWITAANFEQIAKPAP